MSEWTPLQTHETPSFRRTVLIVALATLGSIGAPFGAVYALAAVGLI